MAQDLMNIPMVDMRPLRKTIFNCRNAQQGVLRVRAILTRIRRHIPFDAVSGRLLTRREAAAGQPLVGGHIARRH